MKMGENGLTALHIAAYNGRMETMLALIKEGAIPDITNTSGMNVIHFAAQGNRPWPIAYFHEMFNLPLETLDADGNTPLHWACNCGAILTIELLLKWTTKLDALNSKGEACIHLAVESALASEFTRSIKLLLFKGADRYVKDANGKNVMDRVKDAEKGGRCNFSTLRELTQILEDPSDFPCLMMKVPIKRNKGTILYQIILVIFQLIHHGFIADLAIKDLNPNSSHYTNQLIYLIISALSFLFTGFLFIKLSYMDPGWHKHDTSLKLSVIVLI